jgi:hypothetical protein
MRALLLAALLTLAGCASVSAPQQDSLVGAWRLVRYVDTPDGGAPVHAFGDPPSGQFMFTADRRASVHIMRNPPSADATITDPDPDACVPEWYCAYFGAYSVDWAAHTWTIHVEGGNIPSFIGTDQTRTFMLDGDRLVLSGAYEEGGRTVRYERVLMRE